MQWHLSKAISLVMAIFLYFFCGVTLPAWSQTEDAYKYTALASDSVQPQLIWLGAKGGIKSYHIKERQWQWYPSVKNVNCLLVDRRNKNIIWAGTDAGLFIFSREKNVWLKATEYFVKLKNDTQTYETFKDGVIFAIKMDPLNHKKVFLATDAGLAHFDRETEAAQFLTVNDGLLEDSISCMTGDPLQKEILWLGSDAGLMSLDVKELKIKRHLSQGEVRGDQIRTIAANHEWVLVNNPGGGVTGYHKEGDYWDFFVPYEQITLADYQVKALFYSSYNESPKLWIGTSAYGVIVIDIVTKVSSRLKEPGLSVTAFGWDGKEANPVWFGIQVCSGGGVGYYSFSEKSWWLTYPMVTLDVTYPVVWKEVQKDQQGF